jgi:hypothetical protein
MSTSPKNTDAEFLLSAQQKIASIKCVERSHLVCVEEFVRGYAQALAEASIISFAQRDDLYQQVAQAVDSRKRELSYR